MFEPLSNPRIRATPSSPEREIVPVASENSIVTPPPVVQNVSVKISERESVPVAPENSSAAGRKVRLIKARVPPPRKTPKVVRPLFKDPCLRLAAEVSKALKELAHSISNSRLCSPSILSDQLHQALQDLDTALKSQPRLFLYPITDNQHKHPPTPHPSSLLALAATAVASNGNQKPATTTNVAIPRIKTDTSASLEWKSKKDNKEGGERRMLRPQLSKIAITSLEFAEALPFAAFASLLVETVARLDLVIEEVEELGRIAHFKEFRPGDEVVVNCDKRPIEDGLENHLPSHGF